MILIIFSMKILKKKLSKIIEISNFDIISDKFTLPQHEFNNIFRYYK